MPIIKEHCTDKYMVQCAKPIKWHAVFIRQTVESIWSFQIAFICNIKWPCTVTLTHFTVSYSVSLLHMFSCWRSCHEFSREYECNAYCWTLVFVLNIIFVQVTQLQKSVKIYLLQNNYVIFNFIKTHLTGNAGRGQERDIFSDTAPITILYSGGYTG